MRVLTIFVVLLSLGSMLIEPAQAQPGPSPVVTVWDLGTPPGSGTGNWNVATNWSRDIVPDVTQEDAAIVNGGGTVQVNSAIGTNVGSVVLGQGTAANESGTLEIQSGGSLNVVDDPTFPADGSVRVGQNAGQGVLAGTTTANPQAGTGIMRILPGGTLNSVSLTLGATANSMITLGGTGAGTATVNTGAVTLGRTLRVIGPNVDFNSSGTGAGINFQGTSIFIPEITGATHSPLKTTGNAALGGTLQVDFNGVTPTQGPSWNIIDAATVSGAFATILPDTGFPLGIGQVMNTRTIIGGNGRIVQLYVQQLPVLTVNRGTGVAQITNPGNAGIELDAYTVQSAAGLLDTATWQSLQDSGAGGAGWFEGNPTNNRISELRSGGTSTLPASGAWNLGDILTPPTQFGQSGQDLTFQYNDPVTQSTVNGVVNYIGVDTNNLLLYADPATGNVKIRNTSPFTVQIDGYTISSAAGSLNSNPASWTSLQDQPGVAPNWFEGNLTDNRVSEVMSTGTTTLTGNSVTTFDLGGLFKTAGAQDLVFQFLLANNSQPNTGGVVYGPAPPVGGLPGDYNNNGRVDAADYVVWRKTNVSGAAGYNTWRTNFGRTAGAGAALGAAAVPEPSGIAILAFAVMIGAFARSGKN